MNRRHGHERGSPSHRWWVLHKIENTLGPPIENGYIESFHGRFREESLNRYWPPTLEDAHQTIETRHIDYNQARPHSPLGYLTPDEFAIGHAHVESTGRSQHVRSLDGGCKKSLQLNSNPSTLIYPD